MKQVQDALRHIGIPVMAGVWRATSPNQNPPAQYVVYSTTKTEDAHQDDHVQSFRTYVYLNLWSDIDPTDAADRIRSAMYAAGFVMVEESDKGYNQPAYDTATHQYFFDHIQLLFNQRWFPNSSKLMNAIYDCLLPALSDSYQFLHQKAKGKLIIAQVQLKNERYYDGKETLKEALFNITRAIKLAEQYPDARNIKETLLHMVYTEGRILIEYGCIAEKFIPQAVDVCYQLYEMQKDVKHDAYDFTTGTGNDRISFEKFKSILIQDTSIRRFSDLDMEKTEFLIKRWTKMNFKITKKRRPR